MNQQFTPSHPNPHLDAAARAVELLDRISGMDGAMSADGSPWECLRALEEQERQLAELSSLLQELEVLRHEMAATADRGRAPAAYEVLVEVLAPVEAAARNLMACASDLAARRRALSTSLDATLVN
jgi:hypothetical protein